MRMFSDTDWGEARFPDEFCNAVFVTPTVLGILLVSGLLAGGLGAGLKYSAGRDEIDAAAAERERAHTADITTLDTRRSGDQAQLDLLTGDEGVIATTEAAIAERNARLESDLAALRLGKRQDLASASASAAARGIGGSATAGAIESQIETIRNKQIRDVQGAGDVDLAGMNTNLNAAISQRNSYQSLLDPGGYYETMSNLESADYAADTSDLQRQRRGLGALFATDLLNSQLSWWGGLI